MHASVMQEPGVGVKPGGVIPSVTLVWVQAPVAVLHASVVQGFWSSHWASVVQPVVVLDVVPDVELELVLELELELVPDEVVVAPPLPWEKKSKFWVQARGRIPKEPMTRARIVAGRTSLPPGRAAGRGERPREKTVTSVTRGREPPKGVASRHPPPAATVSTAGATSRVTMAGRRV
jgi:hypothetical protein